MINFLIMINNPLKEEFLYVVLPKIYDQFYTKKGMCTLGALQMVIQFYVG